jgi:hypothetical protein
MPYPFFIIVFRILYPLPCLVLQLFTYCTYCTVLQYLYGFITFDTRYCTFHISCNFHAMATLLAILLAKTICESILKEEKRKNKSTLFFNALNSVFTVGSLGCVAQVRLRQSGWKQERISHYDDGYQLDTVLFDSGEDRSVSTFLHRGKSEKCSAFFKTTICGI